MGETIEERREGEGGKMLKVCWCVYSRNNWRYIWRGQYINRKDREIEWKKGENYRQMIKKGTETTTKKAWKEHSV